MEAIRLVPKEQSSVNSTAVERLEIALEKARNGEFSGVAIVATCSDGSNFHSYSGSIDRLKLIGQLEWVRYRMLKVYDEEG